MLVRDAIPLKPSLDCRVIAMAQLAGYRADTTTRANEVCVGHGEVVRTSRTLVNVENVHGAREKSRMVDKPTIGSQLRSLQEAAGLSYDAIATKAGYSGRSSVQRYFSPDYDPDYLPPLIARKLADAFEGTRIDRASIMALAGLPETNATVRKLEGSGEQRTQRNLPIYGTALGAPQSFDGKAVEQTMLNSGEVIGHVERPPVLNGVRDAYALYMQGSSMSPRYDDGEFVVVTHGRFYRPPAIGDDVVVYFRHEEHDDGESAQAVMVKRLVRRTAQFFELEQFNPPLTFKVEADRVLRLDRVMPWSEILS